MVTLLETEDAMNKDQVKGTVENVKGRVKQAAGALTGSKKTESEGMAERVKGAAQKKVGDLKHDIAREVETSGDAE
jgi:uncharacterized protein YjbJ (UPF0337 family)